MKQEENQKIILHKEGGRSFVQYKTIFAPRTPSTPFDARSARSLWEEEVPPPPRHPSPPLPAPPPSSVSTPHRSVR